MEPVASSAASALRLASGAASDASQLLRQGRVLAAEVLARSPDGTLQLALGRHVVPAKTELRLEVGARFLVRVAEEGGEPALLVVDRRADEGGALASALRRVIGAERPLGELLSELAQGLRAERALPEEARALAGALEALVARPGAAPSGTNLRALLLALGLGHEAALAASGGERAAVAGLREDLKALLVRALRVFESAGESPGEAAETLRRALAGLEAEQLLNLARSRAGEPLVLSFPVPDGERWATARLRVPPRPRDGEPGADPEADVFRVALELELSRLGPLRADLALGPGHLAVRLTVARAELVPRLLPELERVRARLAGGQRVVELSVRAGTEAEVRRGFEPPDVGYLREHPLVDLAG